MSGRFDPYGSVSVVASFLSPSTSSPRMLVPAAGYPASRAVPRWRMI